MKNQFLATAIWTVVSMGFFALGWWMKPPDQAYEEGPITSGGSRSVATASGLRSMPPGTLEGRPGLPGNADTAVAAAAAVLALTSERIDALGLEFRTATDPILKREAFAKLLAGLTSENALKIRQQIENLDSDDPNFRDFHFAWGKIGGREAVLNGAKTDKRDMAATLAGWASAEPGAARAWFESLAEKGAKGLNRESLKEAFVHGLAIADPARAVDFVMGLGKAGDPRSKELMSIVAGKMIQSQGVSATAGWASALPEGDLRGHALFDVAKAMVRENPAAAAKWAATQTGDKNGSAIIYGISSEWGARDGAATVKWLDSLGGNQSAGYGPAMAGWAKADPLAASKRIDAMPPSENRNQAIGGLVYSVRWEDPVSSIAWANQITNPGSRQEVLSLAAGAYLKSDRAAATAWLPDSGLSAEAQSRLLTGKR